MTALLISPYELLVGLLKRGVRLRYVQDRLHIVTSDHSDTALLELIEASRGELKKLLEAHPWLLQYPDLNPEDVIETWFPDGSVDVCRKDGSRAVYIPASRLHSCPAASRPTKKTEEWVCTPLQIGTDSWMLGTRLDEPGEWQLWFVESSGKEDSDNQLRGDESP